MGAERQVKLFRNGRNRAVRIPKQFDVLGDDLVMRLEQGRIVLEPAKRKESLAELIERWRGEPPLGPEDDFPKIDDPPPEPLDPFAGWDDD
jgi:antitoxin VapB